MIVTYCKTYHQVREGEDPDLFHIEHSPALTFCDKPSWTGPEYQFKMSEPPEKLCQECKERWEESLARKEVEDAHAILDSWGFPPRYGQDGKARSLKVRMVAYMLLNLRTADIGEVEGLKDEPLVPPTRDP